MPEGLTENRLMMEVHFYGPYEFTWNEGSDVISQWSSIASNPDNSAT